jgi:hypothetical protein
MKSSANNSLACAATVFAMLTTDALAAASINVSAGCNVAGNLGSHTGSFSCAENNGSIADWSTSVADSRAVPEGGGFTTTVFDMDHAWRNKIDPIPPTEIAYAKYAAHGNYGDIGVETAAAVAGSLTTNGVATAHAFAGVSSTDEVRVMSNTLPFGTFVDVNLDYRLDGNMGAGFTPDRAGTSSRLGGSIDLFDPNSLTSFSHASFCVYTAAGPDCLIAGVGDFAPDFGVTSHSVAKLQVGVAYTIQSYLYAESVAQAELRSFSSDSINTFHGGSTHVTAYNSLNTFLTATSSDYQIVSESGHDYSYVSSPVPELATWQMLAVGMLVVVGLSRRQLKRA